MAYYNGFPVTYASPYTQFAPVQQQNPSMQPSVQGGRIWVQGEAGAKSYLVAPNNTVDLWDSENQVIYQKSADASGMPSVKVLDYTVRDPAKQPSVPVDDNLHSYATKSEIEAVMSEITALRKKVDKLIKKQEELEDE